MSPASFYRVASDTAPAPVDIVAEPVRLRALIAIGLLAVCWIGLLPVSLTPHPAGTRGSMLLLALACAALLLTGRDQMHALARGAAVMRALRTPAPLWRVCVKRALRTGWRDWLAINAIVLLQLIEPASTLHWYSGLACTSVALCAGLLWTVARQDWLPAAAASLLQSALFALLAATAGACLAAGLPSMLDWFNALPPAVPLALTLSWPALAWLLARHCGQAAPPRHASRPAPATDTDGEHRFSRYCASQLRRFRVLQWNGNSGKPVPQSRSDAGTRPATSQALALLATMLPVVGFLLMGKGLCWGQQLPLPRLAMLLYIGVVKSSAIIGRDLHWRTLLLPGGMRRGRLASALLLPDLVVQTMVLTLVALAYMIFEMVVEQRALPDTLARDVLPRTVLLVEMVSVNCCALLLRASSMRKPVLIPITALMMIPALLLATRLPLGWLVPHGVSQALDQLQRQLVAGPAYAATLLASAAILMALANRRWTPQLLFPFMQPR